MHPAVIFRVLATPVQAPDEHQLHLRQFEPGKRPGRARAQDIAGSAGQGIAAGWGEYPGRRQRPAPGIHRQLQCALCQAAGE